jgi:hypothetical protein
MKRRHPSLPLLLAGALAVVGMAGCADQSKAGEPAIDEAPASVRAARVEAARQACIAHETALLVADSAGRVTAEMVRLAHRADSLQALEGRLRQQASEAAASRSDQAIGRRAISEDESVKELVLLRLLAAADHLWADSAELANRRRDLAEAERKAGLVSQAEVDGMWEQVHAVRAALSEDRSRQANARERAVAMLYSLRQAVSYAEVTAYADSAVNSAQTAHDSLRYIHVSESRRQRAGLDGAENSQADRWVVDLTGRASADPEHRCNATGELEALRRRPELPPRPEPVDLDVAGLRT